MEYWQFLREKVGPEKIIIPGVDSAIVCQGKILLIKSTDTDNWLLPGGLQELNETVFETAIREVKEEVGLELTPKNLISVYSGGNWVRLYRNGDQLQTLTFLVGMQVDCDLFGLVQPDPEEIADFGWFDLNDLPEPMQDYSASMCIDVQRFQGTTFLR